ncbi:MAG: hypothetical protein HRT71_11180 [Flavobacteriales bacterium]|nr:hypothetical protein [Flavobacteriales bacterium]
MDSLNSIWKELAGRYSNDEALINECWTELERAYTGSTRHYHNLNHLEFMFEKANNYKDQIEDYDTLLFSIFYHDVVYNSTSSDNEAKSAVLANERLTKLGVPQEKMESCEKQILATKKHEDTGDNDTNFLVDFDLAILGEDQSSFEIYFGNIRKEFSSFPDFIFNMGRKSVIEQFLKMDSIFKTKAFKDSHETQARENLKGAL